MLSKNGNENVPSSVLKAKLLSFATLVNDNFQNEFAYVLNYLALGYANINSDIHGTRIPRTPLQSNISNASQTLTNASGRTLKLQNRRILPFVNDLAMDNFNSSSGTQISHGLLKLSVKQISEKFSNNLDIVTHLDLSRRVYQLILGNSVGKQIEDIVGCNPFMSRHLMERNLREKSKHLKSNEVDLLPSHDPESSQHIGIKLKLHDSKDVYLLSLFIYCHSHSRSHHYYRQFLILG